ncbi:hypothetical protein DSO57_1005633 [Entomophthora muscae]|uniref:Uncharacterized protein n=1 Tax=Entomophthora muscae TaxID=34485 RepID=A0ACC2S9Y2_9FUNG|nr:hypothetical protein DSO57_1005633 [Entomophthora muscae]
MTPPLTPQPNCPMDPLTSAKTTSTQLFGVLYITLTGMLAPILWWAFPIGLAVPCPESPNAPTYAWLPDKMGNLIRVSLT